MHTPGNLTQAGNFLDDIVVMALGMGGLPDGWSSGEAQRTERKGFQAHMNGPQLVVIGSEIVEAKVNGLFPRTQGGVTTAATYIIHG